MNTSVHLTWIIVNNQTCDLCMRLRASVTRLYVTMLISTWEKTECSQIKFLFLLSGCSLVRSLSTSQASQIGAGEPG